MAPLSDVLRLKLNLVLTLSGCPGHIRNTVYVNPEKSTTHVLHLTGEPKHEPPRLEPGQDYSLQFPTIPISIAEKNSQSLTAQAPMLSPKGGSV